MPTQQEKRKQAEKVTSLLLDETNILEASQKSTSRFILYVILIILTVSGTALYLILIPKTMTHINPSGFYIALSLMLVMIILRAFEMRAQKGDAKRLETALAAHLDDTIFHHTMVAKRVQDSFEWKSRHWEALTLMVSTAMIIIEVVNIVQDGSDDLLRILIFIGTIAVSGLGMLWSATSLESSLLQTELRLRFQGAMREIEKSKSALNPIHAEQSNEEDGRDLEDDPLGKHIPRT